MSVAFSKNPVENLMLQEIALTSFLKHPTIQKLHFSDKALPQDVVTIILKWLPEIYKEHVGSGEHLIRSLVFTETDFDPAVIINLFEKSEYNDGLKWTMAHVLSISKVGNISGYVLKQLLERPANFERSGFISALEVNANLTNRNDLMVIIKKIFSKYIFFESIMLLYKKYGRIEDIPFLNDYLKNQDKKTGKKIEKIIFGIKNRKRDPVFPKKQKFIC